MITDAGGVPLACLLSAANRNDVTQLIPLVEAIPPVHGRRGRPRQRPEALLGDRGYDSKAHRGQLRARGIRPRIAKRSTEHGSGLGGERSVVERTISWLHQHRRLSRPLRATRRHPRSVPLDRVQPDLPQTTRADRIVLDGLRVRPEWQQKSTSLGSSHPLRPAAGACLAALTAEGRLLTHD